MMPRRLHGSAHWCSRRTLIRAGYAGALGVPVGRLARTWIRVPPKQHALVIAPTQGGKSTLLINDLVTWGGAAMVGDPKGGELYARTARWRESLGPVWRFAPASDDSCRINLLDRVRVHTVDEWDDVHQLAKAMLDPAQRHLHETDAGRYFRQQATEVLTAATVCVLHRSPLKSFAGVLHAMSRREAFLSAMSQDPNAAVRDVAAMVDPENMADRERSAVWNSAMAPLNVYRSHKIAYHTDASNVPWWDVARGDRPATLYLVTEHLDDLGRLYPLYRAVVAQLKRELSTATRGGEWQAQLLIDELPAWGYMDVFEQGIAELAGFGVSCVLAAQDLGQLWSTYGEHTAIWGNTAVKVFHTPASDETARRLSRMLDDATVPTRTVHHGRQGRSFSEQTVGRPLLTFGEVRELHPRRALVFVKGMSPALAWQLYWRDHRWLRQRVASW